MSTIKTISTYITYPEGKEPRRQTEHSACIDIQYNGTQDVVLIPNRIVTLPTGIKWNGIQYDILARIYSRSGLSTKGIFVVNAPGIIDGDYPDEWRVILGNMGFMHHTIKPGDRIAQFQLDWIPCMTEELTPLTNTRQGGLGSTGD